VRKPSPGSIPAAIVKRLRSVRYAIGDVLFVVGRTLIRIPLAIGRAASRFWGSLGVISRRRLVLALSVAAFLVAFLALAVPNFPCSFPGGDSCPPADDAAALVPGDALAYLHANLDSGTHEYSAAVGLADKLPLFSSQIAQRAAELFSGPHGTGADFSGAIDPWFGGEAAIAVLGALGAPQRVELLEVSDGKGATAYAQSLATGTVDTADFEGVEVSTDQRGVSTAQVDGFLVIGTAAGVRGVIATATGADGADSLAQNAAASEIRDQLPEHRFAEAWVSADGVSKLIADDRGTLGTLTPLIAPGSTRGVAFSFSAEDDGFRLAIRSALDPDREKASPSFFAAFPGFEPQLPGRLGSDALAYLGFGDPGATVRALLGQASAQAPGIAAGFADLVAKLQRNGGVNIESDLLGALGDEAAFELGPPPGGATAATAPGAPYLMFVADGVDEAGATKALAALQGSLADTVKPGSGGQAPEFSQSEVSGVQTQSLTISPAIEVTYAVFDGLAAIATSRAGIATLAGDQGGLDESDLFQRATAGFPDQVSLLAFLNLERVVGVAEQLGLASDPVYATFAGEFRRLDGLGLAVSESGDVLSTDARLLIGDPPPAAETSTIAPPSD
jgi:Protein of unknown function (DUF3352)